MRILIIAYYWPPLNAIGSHRPYWWTKDFARNGAEVTVLTTKKYNFDGPLDLKLPDIAGVRVIHVPYITALGKVVAALSRSNIWKALRTLYRKTGASGQSYLDPRKKWLQAAEPLLQQLAFSSDIAISSYSPQEAHELAARIKRINPRLRWVADYRDYWSLEQRQKITDRERAALQAYEKKLVGSLADKVVSVSQPFTQTLSGFLGLPGVTVMNGHDQDLEVIKKRLETFKQRHQKNFQRIVYTGTIYPETQDPRPLLDALCCLFPVSDADAPRMMLEVYGRNIDYAEDLEKVPRYTPYIKAMGYLARDQVLKIQSSADALLIMEGASDNDVGVLTGKLFEYVCAGVPIISIGSPENSEIARILRLTRTGVSAGNESAKIQAALLQLMEKGTLDEFAPDLDQILRFHRSKQSEILFAEIKKWSTRPD